MNLKEFITGLAKKAGIDTNNEDLITLTAASALSEVEMPESLSDGLVKGAGYSKEEAKNDKEIKDYYWHKMSGSIFDMFDEILTSNIDKLPLSEDVKESIKGKEKATERHRALMEAISEVKPSKSKDADKFQEEIENLNKQLKSAKQLHSEEIEKIKQQSKDRETDFIIRSKILSAPIIENVPGGKDFLAEAIIKKVRTEFHLERDDRNNLLIRDKDDPSLEVFKDNEKVDFDKILSNELHPFIKRSDEPKKPDFKTKTEVKDRSKMTYHEMIKAGAA